MPIDKNAIKKALETTHADVDGILSEVSVRVKAIQFLLPDSHQLNDIQRFLYCERETREAYVRASNIFVYDKAEIGDKEKDDVIRSLFYLHFGEPFKYHCYSETPLCIGDPVTCDISQDQFDSRKNQPIRIKGAEQLEKLKNQENLRQFWDAWCSTLSREGYGCSTLWTYIRIRKADGDSTLSSGIVVFNGCLSDYENTTGKSYELLSKISKRVHEALYELTLNLFKLEITRQATRAAISQIMARNMSHNIGSHVSYRATNSQVKKRVRELNPDIDTNKPVFADWLDYFGGRLDKYEIYRNEYLSDFDQSPKCLKFYKDLVLPFCENMFVMDNIAAGEHLHYESTNRNKLRIRCRIDGQEIRAEYPSLRGMFIGAFGDIIYPDHFPYLLQHEKFSDEEVNKFSLEAAMNDKRIVGADDVEVCVHSEQAFYSILENFIRNSAKHNTKDGSDLTVYLDLRKEPTHYKLHIYDNRSQALPEILFRSTEPPGIYQKIKQSLLDDLGRPRRANWGYADMKINSFLLFNSAGDLDDTRLHENFKLTAAGDDNSAFTYIDNYTIVDNHTITSLENNSPLRFGYQIELSLPRKVLWVGDFSSDTRAALEGEGLQVVRNLDSISEELQKIEGLSSFQFAVINGGLDYKQYLAVEEMLPGRVIVLQNGESRIDSDKPSVLLAKASDIPTSSMYAMLRWCWELWLKREGRQVRLYLYFENRDVADNWKSINLPDGLIAQTVNCLQEQETLSDEVTNIVYNHHGGAFKQQLNNRTPKLKCQQDEFGDEMMNFTTKHSIIFFGQGSEDFAALNYPPVKHEDKEMMMYQLMDAATTNVFVVDERIAGYANQSIPSEFSSNGIRIGTENLRSRNWYMYAAGKLFVVHEIKNENTICAVGKEHDVQEKLSLEIDSNRINLNSGIAEFDVGSLRKDVLIIHRTYLDKAKIGMEPETFINMAKRQFGSVFITSGGGYPHNLEFRCRFIPFSSLESCINARLSKNKLNNMLRYDIHVKSS